MAVGTYNPIYHKVFEISKYRFKIKNSMFAVFNSKIIFLHP
jgi:hypothetical protein